MAFFHLRTVPGYHWPPLPDAAFASIWNAYLELDRCQWWEPELLLQHQLRQIRTLLVHCVAHVPYYRSTWPPSGVVQSMDDFRRLPLLPQRTYREQTNALLATRLPQGTTAGPIGQTTDRSGTSLPVYPTNLTQLWWQACYLRDLEWCGLDPTGTLAWIRNTETTGAQLHAWMQGVSFPCWAPALDPLLQTGPSHGMDVRQDVRVQMRWLRRMAPDYLQSVSANLLELARLAREEGPLPGLRVIQAIGTPLTAETQASIQDAFAVPVKSTYTSAQVGYLASSCPAGHGFHVHAENVLLEVLDEWGQPCRTGETGGVYVTHLHNLRAPLVRYEMGEQATVGAERCPCGRGLPLLTRIAGRA